MTATATMPPAERIALAAGQRNGLAAPATSRPPDAPARPARRPVDVHQALAAALATIERNRAAALDQPGADVDAINRDADLRSAAVTMYAILAARATPAARRADRQREPARRKLLDQLKRDRAALDGKLDACLARIERERDAASDACPRCTAILAPGALCPCPADGACTCGAVDHALNATPCEWCHAVEHAADEAVDRAYRAHDVAERQIIHATVGALDTLQGDAP